MYNWSTDEKVLKTDKDRYAIWRIEQMVNFGLGGDKIDKNELKKYWRKIKIDPTRRTFLHLLLHGEQYSNATSKRCA